ncbi:MAG: hypothetical protein KAG26_08030 [Methylococcales bacterium]|nr:hypothetical protein [Methylococcales bacterium]
MFFQAFLQKFRFLYRQSGWNWRRKPYREEINQTTRIAINSGLPSTLADNLSESTLKNAAFYRYLLQTIPLHLSVDEQHTEIDVLDIGCKNFFYVSSLYSYLQEKNPSQQINFHGLEVDTGRLYSNFYRRRDYANYYVKCLNNYLGETRAFYHQGDWLRFEKEKSYALITVFFPFLYADLSDGWGLPRRYFSPLTFYRKCQLQAPKILFFHQGEAEMLASEKLIKKLIKQEGRGEILYRSMVKENPFVERDLPVYSLLWKTGK